jgi:hypothetical protein
LTNAVREPVVAVDVERNARGFARPLNRIAGSRL